MQARKIRPVLEAQNRGIGDLSICKNKRYNSNQYTILMNTIIQTNMRVILVCTNSSYVIRTNAHALAFIVAIQYTVQDLAIHNYIAR